MTVELEQLSCQELVELVTDYVEGALSAEQHELVDRHVETCQGCRTYVEQMRQTIELTGRLTVGDVSPEAELTLIAAFRGWHTA
jgi:anti-sigma factor RsiW